MGVTQCPDNILAPQAQLRPRVFQGCTALQYLDLGKKGQGSTNLNGSLPDCCFLEAGIVALFFFHEYGRRVGMVPRSSLKEGKKDRWWRKERRPQKTNPKTKPQARRPTPPSCSLPYTLGETCETETSDN